MNKLKTLMDIEGYEDEYALLDDLIDDSICPGICMNPNCDHTCDVEPDCANGYCEECGTRSIMSALMLAGVI